MNLFKERLKEKSTAPAVGHGANLLIVETLVIRSFAPKISGRH
jgi:hypothetical protein